MTGRSTRRAAIGGLAGLGSLAVVAAAGCGGGSESMQLSEAAQRGRATYMNVCVACHNANPAVDGALGPNLVGTTRELLEARVLRAEYPPGYTPKRAGGAMPAFPHLAGELDALLAFIDESTRSAKAQSPQ